MNFDNILLAQAKLSAPSVIPDVALGLGIYFLPSIVAFIKKKPEPWTIFYINLFFGALVVTWIWCLILALEKDN